MRKAKNRFERSNQVLAWLKHEWPCGRPVLIRWKSQIVDKAGITYLAETWRKDKTLIIDLSKRRCRSWEATATTVIHEYAHVLTWGPASLEHNHKCDDHSVGFYATEGLMLNVWNHHHGNEHANEFEFK